MAGISEGRKISLDVCMHGARDYLDTFPQSIDNNLSTILRNIVMYYYTNLDMLCMHALFSNNCYINKRTYEPAHASN